MEKKIKNEVSKHPYEPHISDGATKLIIGTMPPYRFCHKDREQLSGEDVDFYYGSRDNSFWDIMGEIFNTELCRVNSEKAVEERKKLLDSHNIGITDIVASCVHKDRKSTDKALEEKEYRDIEKLLKAYPNIDELIYTSRSVVGMINEKVKRNHNWDVKGGKDGKIEINGKTYRVRVLYSPSPMALRAVSAEKRMERYKEVFGK